MRKKKLECQEFFLLEPFFVEKIWGGNRLLKEDKIKSNCKIGESWVVSTLDEGQSKIENQNLSDFIDSREQDFWGEISYRKFVVKYIDAKIDLSIQVHPKGKNQIGEGIGKDEFWYILDADENSGVYLGLKKGVKREEFIQAINSKGAVDKLLNFVPVKKGDCIFVPGGLVHAIGKGIFLAEIQQNSGITYRLWDWNRVDEKGQKRTLHIDKGKGSINFLPGHNDINSKFSNIREGIVLNHWNFTIRKKIVLAKMSENISSNSARFILFLSGHGRVIGKNTVISFSSMQCFLYENYKEPFKVENESEENAEIILIY